MDDLAVTKTDRVGARRALGQTLSLASRVNLAALTPTDDPAACSTGYCLRYPGQEYLVFQPAAKTEFTLNLSDAPGIFTGEWFDVNTGETVPAQPVEGGVLRTFTPAFDGPAALHLQRR